MLGNNEKLYDKICDGELYILEWTSKVTIKKKNRFRSKYNEENQWLVGFTRR